VKISEITVNNEIVEPLKKMLLALAIEGEDALVFTVDKTTQDRALATIKDETGALLSEVIVEVLVACGVDHDAVTTRNAQEGHTDIFCNQYRLAIPQEKGEYEIPYLAQSEVSEYQFLRVAAFSFDATYISRYFDAERGHNKQQYWDFYNWLLAEEPKGQHLPTMRDLYKYKFSENLEKYSEKLEQMIDKALSYSNVNRV